MESWEGGKGAEGGGAGLEQEGEVFNTELELGRWGDWRTTINQIRKKANQTLSCESVNKSCSAVQSILILVEINLSNYVFSFFIIECQCNRCQIFLVYNSY